MMDLYGNGLLLGEKTLDSLWMRQNLTMNNIANVDTPGFKSQYMTFENELAQKIRSALTVKKTSMKNVARGIENMRPSVHTTLMNQPDWMRIMWIWIRNRLNWQEQLMNTSI